MPGTNGAEIVPSYNERTGRLEQLISDRDKDGRADMWAFMDGRRLLRIEIDRDGNGIADRVEHYETPAEASQGQALDNSVIVRAEESAGPDDPVTRQEFYEAGVLRRVEEDTDVDGRVDRWEEHQNGSLVRMDLDLQKRGRPDRRLFYTGGRVERIEVDRGDGVFQRAATFGEGQ